MTIRDDLVAATEEFTATKKAYTAKLTALVNKVNAKQPVTNADWTDLVVNLYDPMTLSSNALRALIAAIPENTTDPQYDDGSLRFYHTAHGATIVASGPGDIAPGGAFLVDGTEAKWSFGKAVPDGNFEVLRNGQPFGGIGFTAESYKGLMVRMNNGSAVIHNKQGQVVYGTPIAAGDKRAHLT